MAPNIHQSGAEGRREGLGIRSAGPAMTSLYLGRRPVGEQPASGTTVKWSGALIGGERWCILLLVLREDMRRSVVTDVDGRRIVTPATK